MNEKPKFWEITPESWGEVKSIGGVLSYYIFRGQADNNWSLKTSIERAGELYQQDGYRWELWHFEKVILKKFISRAHHYIESPPNEDDLIEWLAMVQDYGGPTRLLDFTDSFYLASFFAIEPAIEDACVWGIDELSLLSLLHNKTGIEGNPLFHEGQVSITNYAKSFLESEAMQQDIILPIRPIRTNERMAVQKGLFVFPCNIYKSFESNLCSTFNFPFVSLQPGNANIIKFDDFQQLMTNYRSRNRPSVIKVNLQKKWHKEILSDLYLMNLDSASLFPGLEGFARSLRFIIQSDEYKFEG